MNLFKRAGALALALALTAGCLTGCGQKTTPETPDSIDLTTVTDPYLTTAGLSADTVVATVGESDITADQLLYWIAYSADSLSQYYSMYSSDAELPWDTETESGTLAESVKKNALETAALYTLLPEKAKADGLELSQSYKDSFTIAMDQMAAQMNKEEDLLYTLWYYPLTEELYTALCDSEEYNAQLMEHRFGEGSDGYPTDSEVLTYLEDEEQCYFFKHILLTVEETAAEEGDASASASASTSAAADNAEAQKALIEDILQQLKDSDDPITLFDSLMKEHSMDPGRYSYPEGYLGSVNAESATGMKMNAPVEEACLALEEGQFSDVIEVTEDEGGYHGYHIVLRLPVEGNVDAADYRQAYVSAQMTALQDQWLSENEIVTNETYDKLDVPSFYTTLTVLRDAITAEVTAHPEASEDASAEGTDTSAESADPSASTEGEG